MKPHFNLLLPVGAVSASLIAFAAAFGFRGADPLDAQATDAAVTVLTTQILEKSQFAHQQLDDELAGKFLDRYLDTLDGNHMIFLKSDLDEFSGSRKSLAETTRKQGDTKLAHFIFKRYLQRLDQRVAFIAAELKDGKFDFSAEETYSYDRKEAPHPADLEAAQALWGQQLRYEYLQEKLAGKKQEDIVKTLSRRPIRTAEAMRKLSDKAVLEIYLNALAQIYDPHSDYMGPEQLKSFEIGMNLSLTGIGATLQSEDGYCKIKELVPGGPAARSGLLLNGDRIVGVSQKKDGEFTDLIDLPLSQAVELIRGKKGTSVFLTPFRSAVAINRGGRGNSNIWGFDVAELNKDIAEGLVGTGVFLVANPQALFVKLDLFTLDAAKEHGTHLAVADRQGLLLPAQGGFFVAQREVGGLGRDGCSGPQKQGD